MQLMLRVLAIVAATVSVPLMTTAAMNGGSTVAIAARGAGWLVLAVVLWRVAVHLQRLEERAGG